MLIWYVMDYAQGLCFRYVDINFFTCRTSLGANVRMKFDGEYEVVVPSNLPPEYGFVRYQKILDRHFWEAIR